MGDIYVHVRMKACCRATLKELDERKRKAKVQSGLLAVGSLFDTFSEKPIDEAKKALPAEGEGNWVEKDLERLVQAACEKVCTKHAEEHEGKGEKEEGAYWRDAAAAISGKPVKKTDLKTTPGAHGTHKGRHYVAYSDGMKVGGSRSWRNNNPGNIMAGQFATGHGAIGSDGQFAVFPDEATGKAALTSLLKGDSYKDLSVADTMAKYAPPTENDTKAYTAAVSKATGLDATRTMGSLSDDEMENFTAAIQKHEGWRAGETMAAGASW